MVFAFDDSLHRVRLILPLVNAGLTGLLSPPLSTSSPRFVSGAFLSSLISWLFKCTAPQHFWSFCFHRVPIFIIWYGVMQHAGSIEYFPEAIWSPGGLTSGRCLKTLSLAVERSFKWMCSP